jgi:uncharacterized protein (DUF433 family)
LRRLSFFDLVEAHILRGAVKSLHLRAIKRGLVYLRESYPDDPRPLLGLRFSTDGKALLVRGMLIGEGTVNATRFGQIEMDEMIAEHVKPIDEHLALIARSPDGLPETVYPKTGRKAVSITYGIGSGRPVIEGTRIQTAIIAQRVRAGEKPDELAADYRLSRDAIEAAIQYEKIA